MAALDGKRGFSFHGTGGTLFGIQILNLFLILITLGIYSFWGRVKVRKFLWGQTEVEGDRFAYLGTGGETFVGFLKAMLIFGIPYMLLSQGPILANLDQTLIIVCAILALVLILFFVPIAIVGTRRYRLGRTEWRGIRFSFRKKGLQYFGLFVGGNLLVGLTLTLYAPFFDAKNLRFMLSNTYFGNRNFDFDGNGSEMFGAYVLCMILAVPTLGLSLLWYAAKRKRWVWNHTTLGEARFNCTVTFGGLFGLYFVNALLVLFTLGFGAPWAKVRTMNYLLSNLSLDGAVDFEAIQQEVQAAGATGEELGSFFDLDFDLG